MDGLEPTEEAFIQVKEVSTKRKQTFYGSSRLKFGIVAILANVVAYLHRVNLNMAIVCMIDVPEAIMLEPEAEISVLYNELNLNHSFYDPVQYRHINVKESMNYTNFNHWTRQSVIDQTGDVPSVTKTVLMSSNDRAIINTTTILQPKFDWDKTEISLLLSAYYYGCIFTQVPAGQIAHRFGGKHVATSFFVISMVGTFLSPLAAETHIVLLFAVRVVLGLACGLFIPALYLLIFKWTTSTERATMMAFIISGQPLGIAIAYMSSGFLCALGWSAIFYAHGVLTALMLVLWLYEVHSSPDEHPRISSAERNYLTPAIDKSTPKAVPPMPWKSVLTSSALYASIIIQLAWNWAYFTVIINVPMFLNETFSFNIAENGVLSAIPYIFCTISMMFSGKLSDAIITRKLLGVQRTRKLLTFISLGGTAVCLICAGHVTYELRYVAVILVCISCLFSGLAFGGLFPAFADYSGIFVGTVYAISNSISMGMMIVSAMTAGLLTPNGLQTEWQIVFYISAGIQVFSAIIFGVFGKATLQSWARIETDIKLEVTDIKLEVKVEPDETMELNNVRPCNGAL